MRQPALFIDRDGTLVHPRHYPSRPEELQLYDDMGIALKIFQEEGFKLVVVTNQSGIARGYFTLDDLQRMHAYLTEELARSGVHLDAIYYCPHHPEGIIPELAVECDCRKPRPGMLLRAAEDLELDLQRSWFVGDILDDVEAGNRAGCRTVLVDLGTERTPDSRVRRPDFVARNSLHALSIIGACEQLGPETELTYRPLSWEEDTELTVQKPI